MRLTPQFCLSLCGPILLLGLTAPAFGWGRIGHRVAAQLADSRLTPAAKAAVADILGPGVTLADASNWADEQRRDRPESGAWHYVNVPITVDRYDAKFCPPDGCVVSKIDEFRRILVDPDTSKDARRDALRFLVHFVEDVHQPLHVGDRMDRGGNSLQLRFFGDGTNLHRIWDSGIIEHESTDEAAWLRSLQAVATPEAIAGWGRGGAADWADESLADAKQAYQLPAADRLLKPGDKLGQPYQDFALPVVKRRLAQAGVRLADVLNACFP